MEEDIQKLPDFRLKIPQPFLPNGVKQKWIGIQKSLSNSLYKREKHVGE